MFRRLLAVLAFVLCAAASSAGQAFDLATCEVKHSPDFRAWPITTRLTFLELGAGGVRVEFSKKEGTDRWPDHTPPGWDGPLQYSLGMVMAIDGRCYASAPIEIWHGLERSGGAVYDATVNGVGQVAANWFYDERRWGPMRRQPAPGELVGFFVCAGDCRGNVDGSGSPVKERSNVVAIAWPGGPASYPPFAFVEGERPPDKPPIDPPPPGDGAAIARVEAQLAEVLRKLDALAELERADTVATQLKIDKANAAIAAAVAKILKLFPVKKPTAEKP